MQQPRVVRLCNDLRTLNTAERSGALRRLAAFAVTNNNDRSAFRLHLQLYPVADSLQCH
jgi:hypothetical protein